MPHKRNRVLEIVGEVSRFDFRLFDRLRRGESDSLWRKEKRRFRNSLYYFARRGLVKKSEDRFGHSVWHLISVSSGHRTFPSAVRGFKVITFDIPEKEKWKRRWLRDNLAALGFRMVQRSVWTGRRDLPKKFVEKLAGLAILPYIKIWHTVPGAGSGKEILTIMLILTGLVLGQCDFWPDFPLTN